MDAARADAPRRLPPSGDCRTAACCTSAASPFCWYQESATHTGRTCAPVFDLCSPAGWLRCAPPGQTRPLAPLDRNNALLQDFFRLPSAWSAWDVLPSLDSVCRWLRDELPHPFPRKAPPSLVLPAIAVVFPRPVPPWRILPTVAATSSPGLN